MWLVGKAISVTIDNLLLMLYGMEVTSSSLQVKNLVVGHSTGVVLGGNGIRCSGTLHISSGVVFARRKREHDYDEAVPFFDIEGDLFVGANSVLLGPLRIVGPTTIGALSLISHNIEVPGTYLGIPAKKID